MKPLIFFCSLLSMFFQNISGQEDSSISKGHLLTGGSLGFRFENSKTVYPSTTIDHAEENWESIITFESDLYFGYYILSHLATGLITNISLSVDFYKNTLLPSSIKTTSQDFSLGPFVRYSLNNGIFFEGSFILGLFSSKIEESQSFNWNRYSYCAGMGYSLFLTNSLAIEPQIKYIYSKRPNYTYIESIETSGTINLSIGFQIYLDFNKQNKNP